MADFGDQMGHWFYQVSQSELSRLLHYGLRDLPNVYTSLLRTTAGGRHGSVTAGAAIGIDRGNFEEVLRQNAEARGLSVEDSEWEAKTITEMFALFKRGVEDEYDRRGYANPPWSCEVINGQFEDGETAIRVCLSGPQDRREEVEQICSLVWQRVRSLGEYDTVVFSREVADELQQQLSLVQDEEFPFKFDIQERSGEQLAAITFPRTNRSSVELALELATCEVLAVGEEGAVKVRMPAESVLTLGRSGHFDKRRAEVTGEIAPNRTLGADTNDGLYRPVIAIDATSNGAEVADIYVAAQDLDLLMSDVRTLGIRTLERTETPRDGHSLNLDAAEARTEASASREVGQEIWTRVTPRRSRRANPVTAASREATDIAHRLDDVRHDHGRITDPLRS